MYSSTWPRPRAKNNVHHRPLRRLIAKLYLGSRGARRGANHRQGPPPARPPDAPHPARGRDGRLPAAHDVALARAAAAGGGAGVVGRGAAEGAGAAADTDASGAGGAAFGRGRGSEGEEWGGERGGEVGRGRCGEGGGEGRAGGRGRQEEEGQGQEEGKGGGGGQDGGRKGAGRGRGEAQEGKKGQGREGGAGGRGGGTGGRREGQRGARFRRVGGGGADGGGQARRGGQEEEGQGQGGQDAAVPQRQDGHPDPTRRKARPRGRRLGQSHRRRLGPRRLPRRPADPLGRRCQVRPAPPPAHRPAQAHLRPRADGRKDGAEDAADRRPAGQAARHPPRRAVPRGRPRRAGRDRRDRVPRAGTGHRARVLPPRRDRGDRGDAHVARGRGAGDGRPRDAAAMGRGGFRLAVGGQGREAVDPRAGVRRRRVEGRDRSAEESGRRGGKGGVAQEDDELGGGGDPLSDALPGGGEAGQAAGSARLRRATHGIALPGRPRRRLCHRGGRRRRHASTPRYHASPPTGRRRRRPPRPRRRPRLRRRGRRHPPPDRARRARPPLARIPAPHQHLLLPRAARRDRNNGAARGAGRGTPAQEEEGQAREEEQEGQDAHPDGLAADRRRARDGEGRGGSGEGGDMLRAVRDTVAGGSGEWRRECDRSGGNVSILAGSRASVGMSRHAAHPY